MNSELCNPDVPSFDDLVSLAKCDPTAFDELKRSLCKQLILSSSQSMQDRLWAQQSHIDLVISHCKNPNHVNVELMKELAIQIRKFQDALDGRVSDSQVANAEVIPFEPWR